MSLIIVYEKKQAKLLNRTFFNTPKRLCPKKNRDAERTPYTEGSPFS
jgi:hypothetical protein